MVTNDSGCLFKIAHIVFVVGTKVVRIVIVKFLDARSHPANDQVEGAAYMVSKINYIFSASIFHWTLSEIVSET